MNLLRLRFADSGGQLRGEACWLKLDVVHSLRNQLLKGRERCLLINVDILFLRNRKDNRVLERSYNPTAFTSGRLVDEFR